MTATPPPDPPQTVDQTPEFQALHPKEQEEMMSIIESTQQMQEEVDKWCAVMGAATFFLARQGLYHELRLRTLNQENRVLHQRLRALEEKVS